MDLDVTADQARLRDAARDFALRELAPLRLDAVDGVTEALRLRMGALGLLGVRASVEQGGAALDALALVLAVEELSAACPPAGVLGWATNALFVEPLRRFGSAAQKAEVLAPVVAGKALGCLAIDEAAHPSAAPMSTTAERRADGSLLIRGDKRFTVLPASAHHLLVIAKAHGTDGTTALLVRRGAEGISVEAGSSTVRFDGVVAAAADVVGQEGEGHLVVDATTHAARLVIAAHAVGIARAALDRAVDHVKRRKETTASAALQSATFTVADMATGVDAARLLVHRAAAAWDSSGDPDAGSGGEADTRGACSMAKLFASQTATKVTLAALELFGLEGDLDLERLHRAARRTELEAGAADELRGRLATLEAGGTWAVNSLSRGVR